MNLHLNAQEQTMQIEKLFADYPDVVNFSLACGILFLRIDDLMHAHYYANIISMSGWAVTVIKNSFCDKAILQVYLHRS
jgi:hypothetical protein